MLCVHGSEVVSWCANAPAVCLDPVGVSHMLPKKRGHFLPLTPFLSLSLAQIPLSITETLPYGLIGLGFLLFYFLR